MSFRESVSDFLDAAFRPYPTPEQMRLYEIQVVAAQQAAARSGDNDALARQAVEGLTPWHRTSSKRPKGK